MTTISVVSGLVVLRSPCVASLRGLVSARSAWLVSQRAAVLLQVCRKSICTGKFLSAPRISRAHVLSETVYMYSVCCVVSEKK